ncbi:radical SAM protein [Proteiniclasticum sp. QWL-01]|uniref:radical SAM protein n=1 Tax=Proteiniclasticum sp. QWL-01 TaxID=3036945 RepID=UPI00321F80B3
MQRKKPEWLKVSFNNEAVEEVALLMHDMKLNTVCKEANCPNLGECYSKKTATFMIMGSQCTRNCRFCNVTSGKPHLLDPDEPLHLAEAVERLGLEHVVITQVTRVTCRTGERLIWLKQFVRSRNAVPALPPKS